MNMLMIINLGNLEIDIITTLESIFNYILKLALEMMNKNPQDFANDFGIWNTIENINDKVTPVASALLALFFFIGFCENCIDVKEELNFELCLKLFIRIGIAEYFVVNSMTIILSLFNFTTNMAGLTTSNLIDSEGNLSYKFIALGIANDIGDTSNTGKIVLLFPILMLLIIAVGSAAVILITVYMRFLKILIAVPYGTIAFSTISSGSHWLNGTVSSFIKYLLSVLLEAFSLGIALNIGLHLIRYNTIFDVMGLISTNSLKPFSSVIVGISNSALILILILTLVRTSQKIAGKVLALDR